MDVKITSQCLYTGRALSTREIKSVAYRMSHVKETSIPTAWHVLRLEVTEITSRYRGQLKLY